MALSTSLVTLNSLISTGSIFRFCRFSRFFKCRAIISMLSASLAKEDAGTYGMGIEYAKAMLAEN
jgi:hypothetical protein